MDNKNRCPSVWSAGLFVVGCSKGKKHNGLHSATCCDALDDPKERKWATIVWGD